MQACSAGRGQSGFSRHLFGRAPGCNDREAEALSRQRSHQALRLSARQRRLWAEIGRLGPGQDRATKARVRRERRCLCRAPGAQTAAAQGSPEPSPSSPLGSRAFRDARLLNEVLYVFWVCVFLSKNALYRPKFSSGAPPRAPGQDRTLGRVRGVLGGAAVHQYGVRLASAPPGEAGPLPPTSSPSCRHGSRGAS